MSGLLGVMPSSAADPDVVAFRTAFGLSDAPVFLTYLPQGYGPDWCHASAKAHALKHGGRRVHGWALWRFPDGLMGDFHSVWEEADGTLTDVTPPKFGATQVLFVRDRVADIFAQDGVVAQPNNRMPPPSPPYWYEGKSTPEDIWGFPADAAGFVAYCASVGLAISDYPTDPVRG